MLIRQGAEELEVWDQIELESNKTVSQWWEPVVQPQQKEQNSMAAKLVAKFPKDVFASARQTNCIKLFDFGFSVLIGCHLKLIMLLASSFHQE